MANRSLYGRARRDSFLQRWFAKSRTSLGCLPLLNWEFWEFSQTPLSGFLQISTRVYPVFYWFSCEVVREFSSFPGRFGNFRQ